MGTQDRTVKIIFGADLNRFTKGLDNAHRRLGEFKKKIDNIDRSISAANRTAMRFVGGMLAIGGAVTGFAIKNQAYFEMQALAFETLLGDMEKAKDLMEWLDKFAATTPMDLPQLIDATKLLLAYNEQLERVPELLKMFGEASSIMGVPLDRVIAAYEKLKAGLFETEQLAIIGVTREAMAAKGVGFTKAGSMTSTGAEAAKAFEEIMVERFGGAWEKVAETSTGKLSNIKDNIFRIFKDIGEAIAPTFKDMADGIIANLGRADEWIRSNSGKIQQAFKPIVEWAEKAQQGFEKFFDTIERNPEVITKMIEKVIRLVGTGAKLIIYLTAASWILKFLAALTMATQGVIRFVGFLTSPVGLLASMAALLVYLTQLIYKNSAWAKEMEAIDARVQASREAVDKFKLKCEELDAKLVSLTISGDESTDTFEKHKTKVVELIHEYPGLRTQMGLTITETGDLIDANGKLYDSYDDLRVVLRAVALEQEKLKLAEQFEELSEKAKDTTGWVGFLGFQNVEEQSKAIQEREEARYRIFAIDLEIEKLHEEGLPPLPGGDGDGGDGDGPPSGDGSAKESPLEKAIEDFRELGKETSRDLVTLEEQVSRGMVEGQDVLNKKTDIWRSSLEDALEIYHKVQEINPNIAAGMKPVIDGMQKQWEIAKAESEAYEKTAKVLEERVPMLIDEVDFQTRLESIGKTRLQQMELEIKAINKKIGLYAQLEDSEKDILKLQRERELILTNMYNLIVEVAREGRLRRFGELFDEGLRELEQKHRGQKISLRYDPFAGRREQLDLQRQQAEERASYLRQQDLLLPDSKFFAEEREGILEQIRVAEESAEDASEELAALQKSFWENIRLDFINGISNLLQSAASGDIFRGLESFFSTVQQIVVALIQKANTGISGMIYGGIAGIAMSFIGGLFGLGKGGRGETASNPAFVHVTNLKQQERQFNMPASYYFRGGADRSPQSTSGPIYINVQGAGLTGRQIAQTIRKELTRGVQGV